MHDPGHKTWRPALGMIALCAVAAAGSVAAQDEHAKHHPAAGAAAAAAGPQPAGAGSAPMAGPAMGAGMDRMMDKMSRPPQRALYPSMMYLSDLAPERRREIERQAHERMTSATQAMSAALGAMSSSAQRNDYAALQAATKRMRQSLAQFESGLAAHRSLAEGRPPPEVALQWFKREMSLASAELSDASPRLVLGVAPFHLLSMAIVAAFAAIMVGTYLVRLRRARALASQLLLDRGAAPAQAVAAQPGSPGFVQVSDLGRPSERAPVPQAVPTAAGNWSGTLRVAKVFEETTDVKTFRLAPLAGEELPFTFEPGQFVTLAVDLDGKLIKRPYSLASSPCCRGWCEVTVRRTPGGTLSGYLHERVKVGDAIGVSGPYGRFTFRGETPSVVMIAGGVGVTPMMSAIRYLTDQSWPGEIFLVYACASLDKVIFREEIDYLARRHANLRVTLVLSDESSPSWTGERGLVNTALLRRVVPDLASHRVHLCGPPPMMEAVKRALADAGVPPSSVRTELFLPPERAQAAPPSAREFLAPAVECTFTRAGKKVPLTPDKTVLEAAEEVGVAIDYSCRQGFCGVCKVKLVAGRVAMEVEDGLSAQDKAAGYILACQAKATGSVEVDA